VESLRERYALPVVGMEPGIKPAVQGSSSGVVGILATAGMAGSQRMSELVQRFAADREVIIRACPGLVEQVERHALDTPETARLLQQYLAPMLERGADTVVLGCTHYPFLRPLIQRLAGPRVNVIDTGAAVARRLQQLLEQAQLLNPAADGGAIRFYSSAATQPQAELFSRLLGAAVEVEPLLAEQPESDNDELKQAGDERQATT